MPMVVRKVSQVGGLLLLMSTLLLLLGVSLYTPEAPNANHYVSDGSTMGQQREAIVREALASWADWALQGFGSAIALLIGIADSTENLIEKSHKFVLFLRFSLSQD